jgi:hypothetical protein
MANPKDSVKSPSDPWSTKKITPTYPNVFGERGPCGETTIKYSDRSDVGTYSKQDIEATGSFTHLSADSEEKENISSMSVGNVFDYVADGKTSQTDGHIDENGMSTWRSNCMGARGDSAKKSYKVFTEGGVEVYGAAKTVAVTGNSSTFSAIGTFGDQVCEHSGNCHEAYEKDKVEAVKGNKVTMIEEGDYAIHTNKGNFDLQVSEGKLHLMTSADDLIANSNVKVLLQVGSQSKVTVEPSKVRLEVGGGSYIEITSGSIKMVSPRIDLN